MKRKAIIISLLALALRTAAQQVWTMDSCIHYALEHSAQVQLRRIDVSSSNADRMQATADFLPNISGQIGGQFSWGRGIDPETNTYTTVTTFSNSEGIYASWTAFDGGRTAYRFKQACVAQRQAYNSLRQARDDKAIEVMYAFTDAVYADGCHALAQQRLAEAEKEWRKAQLQAELGTMSRPDVAMIEAQMAQAEYNLMRQAGEKERTMRTLALTMNKEGAMQLSADDELAEMGDNVAGLSMLPTVIAATLDVNQAQLQQRIARSYMMPTLSLSAGFSTGYYSTIRAGNDARPFMQQMKDNMGRYLGATLSFPLFGNMSRITSLKKARYSLASAIIQRDETLRKIEHDVMQAEADCRQGAKEIVALTRKVEADSLAYSLALRQFDEGLLTAQNLIAASRELQDARISLLQARLTLSVRRRLVNYYHTGSITQRFEATK